MSALTTSEELFERLCTERGIVFARIPKSTGKTADYQVFVASLTLITEVKQLDPSDDDKELSGSWALRGLPVP